MWLARFHTRAPKAGPISHPKEFVSSKPMQRWSAKIARLEGPSANQAEELFQRLNLASASLSEVELRAGHGSYNSAHVYFIKDRTVTIDWDWHDIADPARDVARFLYALRRRALDELGSIRALDKAADVFLETYQRVGAPIIEKNLRFFGAVTCLNLALRHLFDEGSPCQEKQERADAMLDEGLSALGGGIVS
jgi:aminoglycoside phosphotransferase (APT) family kinase protein